MFKNVLTSIEGVGLLPSLTFLAFFVFFIVVCILVVKMDRQSVERMSSLPLDENSTLTP
jgi:hypothetical protein